MPLDIFNALPDVAKKLIVEHLLSNTVGVEIHHKPLPIGWLFSRPNEEDSVDWELYTDSESAIWVDIYKIETEEIDLVGFSHLSTLAGIQLATHWNLVDKVYLKPVGFGSCGGLWRGPRFTSPFIYKGDFEEFRKYYRLASGLPRELDPFMIKEYHDIIYRQEKKEEW